MKRKALVALALAVAMVTGSFSGCSSSDEGETGKSVENSSVGRDKVNLKFYIWSDEESYMQKVVDNYNASQNNNIVELVSVPNYSYGAKLEDLLYLGGDADIVDIRMIDHVTRYKASNVIMDLTDMVKKSNLDISKYGTMWDAQYPEGEIYALPTRSTCWVLFYNEDILRDAGVTMPEQLTWDEYAELAKQLTKDDKSVWGGYWVSWDAYNLYATQKETYLNDDDITNVRDSLELLNKLINQDQSHVPLAEVIARDAEYLSAFKNGEVAMMPQGEWLINMFLENVKAGKPEINWNVAPMPIPNGVEAGTTIGQFQFAAIPENARNPAASFDFLKYLCGEGGSVVLPQYGMIPAYSGDEAKDVLRQVIGKESVIDVIFNAKKVLESSPYKKYSELLGAIKENAERYLLGEQDIDKTMQLFEKQRRQIMAD